MSQRGRGVGGTKGVRGGRGQGGKVSKKPGYIYI